jgi:hypothetical protein
MIIYLGWLLVIMGVAQLYAGAGGVSRTAVRCGQALVLMGLLVVVIATVVHLASQ